MFVFVVGPSGAGKDTLLRGAMAALGTDIRFVFARRVITRPVQPDAEDHETLDEAGFAAARTAGAFALNWEAHGLWYGIPAAYAHMSAAGRVVVVNGSRSALDEAMALFPDARVVLITAREEERAKRLAQRGRETEAEILERLRRQTPQTRPGTLVVDNSGPPDAGIAALVETLRGLAA